MLKKRSLLFVLCSLLLQLSNVSATQKSFTRTEFFTIPVTSLHNILIEPLNGSVTLKTHSRDSIELKVVYESSIKEDLSKAKILSIKGTARGIPVFFFIAPNDNNFFPSSCSASYEITLPTTTIEGGILKKTCTEIINNSTLLNITENETHYLLSYSK